MFLFLQGAALLGKSTLLREALLPYRACVAGLLVQRLFAQGVRCGFRACAVSGELPPLEREHRAELGGVFLYQQHEIPGVLDCQMLRALEYCAQEHCKLILLDEIGGVELQSPLFRRTLEEIFALGKPCLGVIKSQENFQHMAKRLGFTDARTEQNHQLHQRITAEGEILTATGENLEELRKKVIDCFKHEL